MSKIDWKQPLNDRGLDDDLRRVRNVTETKVGIEAWAIKIAIERCPSEWKWTPQELLHRADEPTPAAILAFARYVMTKEEAPVDPDRIAARQLCEHHGIANPFGEEESIALAAIKRGRELERGEVK